MKSLYDGSSFTKVNSMYCFDKLYNQVQGADCISGISGPVDCKAHINDNLTEADNSPFANLVMAEI